MATSVYEKVRNAMAPQTTAMTIMGLCNALLALEALANGRSKDLAERITEDVIIEELCTRHSEIDEASLRWSEDPEATETHTEVVVAAALAVIDHNQTAA